MRMARAALLKDAMALRDMHCTRGDVTARHYGARARCQMIRADITLVTLIISADCAASRASPCYEAENSYHGRAAAFEERALHCALRRARPAALIRSNIDGCDAAP